MKTKLLLLLASVGLLLAWPPTATAETGEVSEEMKAILTKVQTKVRAGDRAEANFTDELKELDTLLEKHKNEKTDEVAQVLLIKSQLYSQIFHDEKKGEAYLAQLLKEFPDTKPAEMLREQEAAKKIRESLVEGAKFPDFEVQDLDGKPLSIAAYKGKVVLVDFWATWCGPCVAELPNVLKAYEKHHAAGFEIVGISLDSDRAKLDKFIKDKNMPWQQFFDGQGWNNKLSTKYGVNSIPATYLLDGNGMILAKNLRGEALEQALAKVLTKK